MSDRSRAPGGGDRGGRLGPRRRPRPSTAVNVAVVRPPGLLPRVLSGPGEVPEPPLRVLLLEGGAVGRLMTVGDLRLVGGRGRDPLRPVVRGDRGGVLLLMA